MSESTGQTSPEMIAVCYRCFYRGPAAGSSKCPACQFALITEAAEPTQVRHLEDIFARYSVRSEAPALPGVGVHPGLDRHPPRARFFAVGTLQDELLTSGEAEVVVEEAPAPAPEESADEDARAVGIEAPTPRRSWYRARVLELFCLALAAAAAGVGAAFLHTAL